jgi:hypothetical protein
MGIEDGFWFRHLEKVHVSERVHLIVYLTAVGEEPQVTFTVLLMFWCSWVSDGKWMEEEGESPPGF